MKIGRHRNLQRGLYMCAVLLPSGTLGKSQAEEKAFYPLFLRPFPYLHLFVPIPIRAAVAIQTQKKSFVKLKVSDLLLYAIPTASISFLWPDGSRPASPQPTFTYATLPIFASA